ncbi:ATP-binding protein [Flaviaesturariibacter terrae]
MPITKIKFSPSINIERDGEYDFNYIATPNSTKVFTQILNDALVGVKSHVIIGAYGTGKSSLLLATKQTLTGSKKHFKGFDKIAKQLPNFEFITIIGAFSSITDSFAAALKLEGKDYSSNDLINALNKRYQTLQKKHGKGLAILIDEFGKFLEFAAKNNPEAELYFIQQLAEWVNNTESQTLLVATLHQDFNAYALALNKSQQQEWQKVKGRLKEVVFNEPVEQLLFLASERVQEKFKDRAPDKNFVKLFDCIAEAKAFPLRDYFDKDFAKKLFPFDILSAAVLTLSLQRYGQNERSLFSFIESQDHDGINEHKAGYYSIAHVYDYLINNYYSIISSKYNPNYTQWTSIRNTLERVDGLLDKTILADAASLVKTIGLLNIFASASAKLEPVFYHTYAKLALGVTNPEEVVAQLEKHKIIRYVRHSFKYVLFEGTDLDIELAIDEAGKIVEKATNVVDHLNQYFEFPFISAKAAYYETGTPRFFQFKLTEQPIDLLPEGEIDGFINLVFNEDAKAEGQIKAHSKQCGEAILFGYYKNTAHIQNTLFEIQKVKKVTAINSDDKAAVKALKEIEGHYIKLLNHYVLDSLYSTGENVVWYFKGEPVSINDRQSFNQALSTICKGIYKSTPVLRNELLNKTRVSGQVAMARRNLLGRLLNNLEDENLSYEATKFPPEKSIYLSLIKETGLHVNIDGVWTWSKPTEKSFQALWEAGESFLASTRSKERSLQEFIEILLFKPFKLKQGFIDFWLPIFLLAKNDEYALYEGDSYQPQLNEDILELINKKPGLFKVKAFDVAGVKLELFNRYRIFLNQAENHNPTNKLFIQTIKPFLVFYRDLPDYAKKTTRGLSKKSIALRNVIASAKDPEKTFFEDFPTALGFSISELQSNKSISEKYIHSLQSTIRELRTSYDQLLDRFETYFIQEVLGITQAFPDYKAPIKERFKKVKTHLLLNHQKSFYNRLTSELDDRKAWLNSVAHACVGKSLNVISDDEEMILLEKVKDLVHELDNLCDISKKDFDEQKEEVFKVEITSFVNGVNKELIRIPKKKAKEVDTKIGEIKGILGKDKQLNTTILAKLLQELMNE